MKNQYITLMSSLPYSGDLFKHQAAHISRYQLDKRLNLLSDKHRQLLLEIENLLHWNHLPSECSDETLIESSHILLNKIRQPDLEKVIKQRLDMRSIIAALRYRQQGIIIVEEKKDWSYGRFVEHIRRNWDHPTFQLQHRFHWLQTVYDNMLAGNTYELEKVILAESWQNLTLAETRHQYNFIAVVLYVLKWDILARWKLFDGEKSISHFNLLLDDALADIQDSLSFQV
ncbi:MAG: hypothetical protein KUG80_07665 [Gammaproteobacteria bacterium]|nr:hypothetical protein [Gammaproteobacteria bacterium]